MPNVKCSRPWLSWCVMTLALFVWPSAAAGQPRCADGWPWRDDLHLSGRLGDREIRGYLGEGLASAHERGVFGLFFYPSTWAPGEQRESMFALDGTFADDCSVTLNEVDSRGEQRATWQLHFVTNERLEGRRQHAAADSLAVSLEQASAPDCSGRGPWQQYSSARWPISFQYPASWRLTEDGGTVTLICPDASRLAVGGLGIILELNPSTSPIEADDGRAGISIGDFITYDNRAWMIGDCESKSESEPYGVFCAPVRKSLWRNMTVLQGSAGEHRLYRFGGSYAGQGQGIVDYLFLIGDTRVAIQSENADVVDQLGSVGPVLFDGGDVTARLVRSIRRR